MPTANKLHVLGSSPLTRGKRGVGQRYSSHRRLIPAHAGKTPSPRLRRERPGAHPRSRGENYRRKPFFLADDGSSPLTRGKRVFPTRAPLVEGLIPAHAGKTAAQWSAIAAGTAHPRSRGENGDGQAVCPACVGSSPLTRGKHIDGVAGGPCLGLIPAHAGKTTIRRRAQSHYPAHPRSRGENRLASFLMPGHAGSSPLTRGKPTPRRRPDRERRLIPAHAGKTRPARGRRDPRSAHPRSRGENRSGGMPRAAASGSSPLTRGKRSIREDERTMTGLIPAHAGKTCPHRSRRPIHRAHPRSRGENAYVTGPDNLCSGSSPLTRGKRDGVRRNRVDGGLIPAHAGKTSLFACPRRIPRAHPRSRGENGTIAGASAPAIGSSPLTRGKRGGTVALLGRLGLIPAHAGKTGGIVFAWNYAAAHPRSRGENYSELGNTPSMTGSSPLTRGKQRRTRVGVIRPRLIPAHAGKTLSRHPLRQPLQAHPRSRGENP